MSKEKSLVEDTFIQMKNLEEVISENAKGILASTMKEEIKSLVKESLNEQDEEEVDIEDTETEAPEDEDDLTGEMPELDDEDFEEDEEEVDNVEMGMGTMPIDTDDDETIDLTNASDEEILKVFKLMGDEDGVIVKKEDDMIHLSDEDDEYLIQLGESYEEELDEEYMDEDMMGSEYEYEEELDEEYMDEDMMGSEYEEELDEEVIYELEIDESYEEELDEEYMDEDMMMGSEYEYELDEDDFEGGLSKKEIDMMFESKSFKAKGMGMGNASKFKYGKRPNMDKGFNVKKKQGTRGVGMGKAKFEYKEGADMGKMKKVEAKEASRTNSYVTSGKVGLRKGSNRNENRMKVRMKESVNEEMTNLREKNEEYRKALNVFRNKLNEVAVFNSNLAYATRLFTEHSTTKQEKINILRRFDGVESLKESKTLYKVIKNELSSTKGGETTITESFERTVEKTPTSGSATVLIESKTYENPQFLRMKDLMSKIK